MVELPADATLCMTGSALDAVLFVACDAAPLASAELAPAVADRCIPTAEAIPVALRATTTTAPAAIIIRGCFTTSPLHVLIIEWIFLRQYGKVSD
jgi:hypothetical protein